MAPRTKKAQGPEIVVTEINQGTLTFHIVGKTPLICNRMSEKGIRELLMPRGRKTAAEKAGTLKHDPYAEYRASPYTAKGDKAPTRIQVLATMFKGAIRNAALDMPGAKKAQIGRLVWVEGERIDLYGKPRIHCGITRSADINHTPDVRTRAIVPNWACDITVSFVQPIVNPTIITNLLSAAGLYIGIGDWRSEKGSGTYGCFRIANEGDLEYKAIVEQGGREAQDEGFADPIAYNDETEELLSWFDVEVQRRGFKVVGEG